MGITRARHPQKDVHLSILLRHFPTQEPWSIANNVKGDVSPYRGQDSLTRKFLSPCIGWILLGLYAMSDIISGEKMFGKTQNKVAY